MATKYQVNNHSVLKVSNNEAKKGASWHDIARRRAFAQHGGVEDADLPDGDIHKVVRHVDTHLPQVNQEEAEEAVVTLEEQIKLLKHAEEERARYQASQPQKPQPQEQFDKDPYDDWFKE